MASVADTSLLCFETEYVATPCEALINLTSTAGVVLQQFHCPPHFSHFCSGNGGAVGALGALAGRVALVLLTI